MLHQPASLTIPVITNEIIPILCTILNCEHLTAVQMRLLCGETAQALSYTEPFKTALINHFATLGERYAALLTKLSKTPASIKAKQYH